MTEIERIDQLREELHRHNYNYYVLNAPEITDQEFDKLMRELQDLEEKHPEHRDENSPSMRVGSDINKNFMQVVHKYPMLSLGYLCATCVKFLFKSLPTRIVGELSSWYSGCSFSKSCSSRIRSSNSLSDISGAFST